MKPYILLGLMPFCCACLSDKSGETSFTQPISMAASSASSVFEDASIETGIDSLLTLHHVDKGSIYNVELSYFTLNLLSDTTYAFADSVVLIGKGAGEELVLASLGSLDSTKKSIILEPSYEKAKNVFFAEDLTLSVVFFPTSSYSLTIDLAGYGSLKVEGK